MPTKKTDFNLSQMPSTLTEWVQFFDTFFAKPNRHSHKDGIRPLRDFTDRLAELGGYITSSKHQSGASWERYYSKYFAWCCGLIAQANLNIEEFIWTRFPEKCPYCGQATCAYVYHPSLRVHSTADVKELNREAKAMLAKNPSVAKKTLTQWFDHFIHIYPINLHRSMGEITERFHEEQSELIRNVRAAESIRTRDGSIKDKELEGKVLEELSDVISWFLTLGAKVFLTLKPQEMIVDLHEDSNRLKINFDSLFFMFYSEVCANCGHKPCQCSPKLNVDRSDLDADEPLISVTVQTKSSQVVDWIAQNEVFDFSSYKVIGDFLVGDTEARTQLRQYVETIRKASTSLKKPYPILICAKPGSGKTFFVNQLVKEAGLNPETDLIKGNLSNSVDIPTTLRQHFKLITTNNKIKYAFLDEIDTIVNEDHAYRHLLEAMQGNKVDIGNGVNPAIPGLVWFFAASKAEDELSFTEYLRSITKGPDFMRRFKETGLIVRIPGLINFKEAIVQVFANTVAVKPNLTHINSFVLYYFASKSWADAGELKGTVHRCASFDMVASVLNIRDIAGEADYTDFLIRNQVPYKTLSLREIRIKK